MKLRKNRLLLLGALALLYKTVKVERIRYEQGEKSGRAFKWNDGEVDKKVDEVEKYTLSNIDPLGNEVRIDSYELLDKIEEIEASPNTSLLKINLSVKGGQEEAFKLSKDNFILESSKGPERKHESLSYLNDQIVNKGETVSGSLVFEIDRDIDKLTLEFSFGPAISKTSINFK